MRSVMRACIGSNRAPDGRYAEIDLPASPYRLLNALDEIGIKSTKEIVYQEILNYGSFGYLEPHFDEYTMLEELNALAQKLAVFDRVDSIAFEGLVKMPVRMSTVLHLLPLRKCRRTTTVTKQVGTLNCVLWRPTNEIERISSAL